MKAMRKTGDPKVARIAIAKLYKSRHSGGFALYDWLIGAPVNERRTLLLDVSARRFERFATVTDLAEAFNSRSQPGRYCVIDWHTFCRIAISKLAAQAKGIYLRKLEITK